MKRNPTKKIAISNISGQTKNQMPLWNIPKMNGKTTSNNLPKMKGKEVILVAILVRIHHGCEALLKSWL